MAYYRGTLLEFNNWHNLVKIAEGLPKIGYINNIPAPQNQQTINYVEPIQNPNGSDDYLWIYGTYPDSNKISLSQADFISLNWAPED